ncbi:FAD-dependent oxidoreductase [Microlunatus sp. GCM10028923]|uniref:FAD-dependent oxidoreductase n=1 Tax=Microlunatus sp. GCM10028923 TaxID=3273400 RepID=UPI0036196B90
MSDYDVVVFGGGPAGVPAALQSARVGARTLLVEKSSGLGGTTTNANIAFPGLFHAWGEQVIAGIGWDLVRSAVDLAGDELPDFGHDDRPHWQRQVRVNAPLYRALLLEAVGAGGVDLLLHTMPARAEFDGTAWTIELCGKEGLTSITAGRVVDCTGDANLVRLAGLAVRQNPHRQPGTLDVRLSGYDIAKLDTDDLNRRHAAALAEGRLRPADLGAHGQVLLPFLAKGGENSIHLTDLDAGTSPGRTEAELAGHAAALRIFRFLRTLPGLEQVRLDFSASEVGIRETVTIEGRTMITAADYLAGRAWPDAVCNSFYPIDVHRPDGNGIAKTYLDHGVVPTIPREAMVPSGNAHLVAAGRCISSDQEANSALRVQATAMATGQAAGALAALSAAKGGTIVDVDLAELDRHLSDAGAILPQRS